MLAAPNPPSTTQKFALDGRVRQHWQLSWQQECLPRLQWQQQVRLWQLAGIMRSCTGLLRQQTHNTRWARSGCIAVSSSSHMTARPTLGLSRT